MSRLLPLALLAACLPTIPDGPRPGVTPDLPDPAVCDDRFAVGGRWSVAISDYGMIRGADAFDASGATFVHSGGAYATTTRTLEVATGALLSQETVDNRMLLGRDAATDTDLVFVQGDLEIRTTSTGRLRGTLSDVGPTWIAPAVVQDGTTLAALRCDDTERGAVSTYDLDGALLRATDLAGFCPPWTASPIDFDEARGLAVVVEGARALLVDVDDGSRAELSPHEPDPDQNPVVGIVHDIRFSPDGSVVASAGLDGRLLLHDTDSGELLVEREVRVTPVNRDIYVQPDTRSPFAWSADGRLLARGLDDRTIVVERLCDGTILEVLDIDAELTPPFDPRGTAPATLHFAPDGGALVAVYEGGIQGFVVGE